ncbi:MAG: hypothetical protein LKG27_07545 [Clostridiaceae bacterium]|jgi:hypothetical protein|nr:hypothetical protein [Clostridiaceae bacterium]
MRWYELNPTVFMAISMIEFTSPETQADCARIILGKIAEITNDCYLTNIVTLSKFGKHPMNRWYDKDRLLSKAIDCLKNITFEQQNIVSTFILDFLKVPA